MLPRFIPVAKSINSIARQQAVRCMSAHAPAHFKTDKQIAIEQKTTMNDLPVPEGSWQENYDKRNSKWNMLLGASSLLFVVTTYALYKSGCFYLHSMPPLTNKPKPC